jgi:hypothetical protein
VDTFDIPDSACNMVLASNVSRDVLAATLPKLLGQVTDPSLMTLVHALFLTYRTYLRGGAKELLAMIKIR